MTVFFPVPLLVHAYISMKKIRQCLERCGNYFIMNQSANSLIP